MFTTTRGVPKGSIDNLRNIKKLMDEKGINDPNNPFAKIYNHYRQKFPELAKQLDQEQQGDKTLDEQEKI